MLLEVETDKAVVEIEAQADGVLGGVTAKVGDVVPVGPDHRLAAASPARRCLPRRRCSSRPAGRWTPAPAAAAAAPRRRCGPHVGGSVRASRRRRARLAREHGVDIASVTRLRTERRDSRRRHPEGREGSCTGRPPGSTGAGAAASRGSAGTARDAASRGSTDAERPGRRHQLHRPHHGRAHHAELDDGAALLRVARRRRDAAQRGARRSSCRSSSSRTASR